MSLDDFIIRLIETPEVAPTSRVVLFGFPSQVAAARAKVVDFLGRVFEPSRFHVNATLRGFYFTSGTQEGTPIDQLIGALSRSFGSEDVGAAAYSGRGRSYFLTDLLRKVVIGEAGWVSTNRAAIRRTNLLRLGAYAGLALASAVLVGLWWLCEGLWRPVAGRLRDLATLAVTAVVTLVLIAPVVLGTIRVADT